MLPKQNRIRSSAQFSQVITNGGRAGNDLLVVHYLADQQESSVPLVGFIVSKRAIPHAVDRNRVKRQLRAIFASQLDKLSKDAQIVIRVSSRSKAKSSTELEKAFLNACYRAKRKFESKLDPIKCLPHKSINS